MPASRIPPGTILRIVRNALGLSVVEVAETLSIPAIKIERMENNHAWTTVATVLDVQRHYEALGIALLYDAHGEVDSIRMPDGSQRHLTEAETGVPMRKPSRPGKEAWEDRIVRTSWGYWVRPRDE